MTMERYLMTWDKDTASHYTMGYYTVMPFLNVFLCTEKEPQRTMHKL